MILLVSAVLSLLVVFVMYDFTVCTGITFDDAYTPVDVRALRGHGRIRLVPLDAFPPAAAGALAEYYRKKYAVAIEATAALPVPAAAFDAERQQLRTDALVAALRRQHPPPAGAREVVIGLLEQDMYIPGVAWRYAISYRTDDGYAVVSSAQLNRGCLGIVRASPERTASRLRKMVTKNIGILHFGLPPSEDPRSVLYGRIGGPQEFDRMSDDF